MGLFDKISTDGTGTMGTFTQQAKAFATLDLNAIFKMGVQGTTSLIQNAISFFKDVFGSSKCNDQDRILVERMWDQIPGMAILLSDMGYLDQSIGDYLKENPDNVYGWMKTGRPKGAEPCNSLLAPARTLFTILFGVRIVNSHTLDALQRGVDDYYAHDNGVYQWDIPRAAVERAVYLKQNFFTDDTYNNEQWNLNRFQEYPLVAPVPDPFQPGVLYTGDFLGVKVVNGVVIGDPIPDIIPPPVVTEPIPDIIDPGTGQPGDHDFLSNPGMWISSHPVESAVIGAVVAWILYELVNDK